MLSWSLLLRAHKSMQPLMSWLKMIHAGMQLNKAAEAIWWWSSVNRGTGSRVKVHWNIPDGGQLQMTVAALLTGRKDGYFSPRNFNQEGGWVALAKCCPSTNIVHWCITGERVSQAKKANGPYWINMGINLNCDIHTVVTGNHLQL